MTSAIPSVTLRSGKKFPQIAFGVGTALYGQDCGAQVEQALSSGFKFLDTAEVYANSQYVGPAIKKGGSNPIVLDKISNTKDIRKVAMAEKDKLQIEKFDALLLHVPPRGKDGNPSNVEAWKEMEKLKDEGIADAIGVSNWLANDIEEVIKSSPKHPIELNQIEYHPFIASSQKYKKLLDVQRRENITTMVYAGLIPITKAPSKDTSLHKIIEEIAKSESGWTPGIVLQKWASQHTATKDNDGIIVSTSGKKERLQEYLSTFTSRKLTSEEIEKIAKAGEKEPLIKTYMVPIFDNGE